jgi:uncharacterized membrane protein YedE/YeeE
MLSDLKQRGLYAHREMLLWLAVGLMCMGSFALGVGMVLAQGCI